jgi:hypothetical protein
MFGAYLMAELCERGNLRAALQQGRANQGAPGMDAMHVEDRPALLKAHWLASKEQVLPSPEAARNATWAFRACLTG